MSITYAKPITTDGIFEDLEKNYEHYLTRIEILEVVLPIVKSWIGKKITKVLCNKIAALLPERFRVYYNKAYSYNIRIWLRNETTRKDEDFGFYLGTNEILSDDKYKDLEDQLNNHKKYVAELETLDSDRVESLVMEWNNKLEEMQMIYRKAGELKIDSFFKIG